jgi:hypothetical protein
VQLGQIMFDVVPSAFVAEVACVQTSSRLDSNSKLAISRSEMIFETSFATKYTKIQTTTQPT